MSRFPILDVVIVVKVTEHVKEKTSIEAEQEVDSLRIVAVSEHNREVMVEDDAELNLKNKKIERENDVFFEKL